MTKANKTQDKNEVTITSDKAVATISSEDAAILAQLTGDVGSSGGGGVYFPRLSVVQEIPTDDEGDPIEYNGKVVKAGTFAVSSGDNTVYAPTVSLRILAYRQQILELKDPDNQQFQPVAETIFFENWSDELLDTKGGIACGRPIGKAGKSLDPAELAAIKKKKPAFLHVWALATVDGFDEPQLVQWRLRGNAYFEANKFFDNFGSNRPYQMFNVTLSTRKEKTDAGKVFYIPVFEADVSTIAPFTDEVRESSIEVLDFINTNNDRIRDENLDARTKLNRDATLDTVAAEVIQAPIDNDRAEDPALDDALPF